MSTKLLPKWVFALSDTDISSFGRRDLLAEAVEVQKSDFACSEDGALKGF